MKMPKQEYTAELKGSCGSLHMDRELRLRGIRIHRRSTLYPALGYKSPVRFWGDGLNSQPQEKQVA